MNSKWIQWSVTAFSSCVFGLALFASGCGGGGGVEEPEKPKEIKKSTQDKSAKDAFRDEKGMPELDPQLEAELSKDVGE